MSTFKQILKEGLVSADTECNIVEGSKPDGCWALSSDLHEGYLLCVSYENGMHALPKLLIDAFINKHSRIPTSADLQDILKEVKASMQVAIDQGKIP